MKVRPSFVGRRMCMDSAHGKEDPGTAIMNTYCNRLSPSQKWFVGNLPKPTSPPLICHGVRGTFQVDYNRTMCISVPNQVPLQRGAKVQIWECKASEQQHF